MDELPLAFFLEECWHARNVLLSRRRHLEMSQVQNGYDWHPSRSGQILDCQTGLSI